LSSEKLAKMIAFCQKISKIQSMETIEIHEEFFNRVKTWCKEKKTTLELLMKKASRNKWSEAVYFGWRKSDGLPKGENILLLARAMGVSCDWLITGKEFAPEVSSSAMEVARKYDALSAGNRLRLEDFLAGLYAADDAAKAKTRLA
jgi:hypothetical protein